MSLGPAAARAAGLRTAALRRAAAAPAAAGVAPLRGPAARRYRVGGLDGGTGAETTESRVRAGSPEAAGPSTGRVDLGGLGGPGDGDGAGAEERGTASGGGRERPTISPEEFQRKVEETVLQGQAAVFGPEREADRMRLLAKRARLQILSDETRNKLEYSFKDSELAFEPEGSPGDHLVAQSDTAWITHMVPVDHARPIVNPRLTLESVIFDKQEWALVTLRIQRQEWLPFRDSFGSPMRSRHLVMSYYTYTVDRTSGERSTFCLSHYATPSPWVHLARWWHQLPLHPLGGATVDIEYDEAKGQYARYAVRTKASRHARAGALHVHVDDTGFNARHVESFAGFKDPESALVYLCQPQVEYYVKRDHMLARRDTWQEPLERFGPVTVGRLLSTHENDDSFGGVTSEDDTPEAFLGEAPEDSYPWIRFWDLVRLNRSRRLHSVLLHRGPLVACQHMPLQVLDDHILEPDPKKKRWRLAWRSFFKTNPNVHAFTSPWHKPKGQLTEAEYQELWRQGKYT
eukprot:TRINITY_DN65955_c0_g1_i1.p2 TRINITY_DN65955_c0_g1~~TRINITY_DN65955_c0_g1_i1.p2  ORF type:complete len:516 (+),score=154.79 TRINITY_DN65955_c0_g1_i1:79-1626(+)